MTGEIELPGLAANQLSPILLSHGWINLAPADQTPQGFRYALHCGQNAPLTVEVGRRRSGVTFSSDLHLSNTRISSVIQTLHHMLSLDFHLRAFRQECRARQANNMLRLAQRGWGRMFRSPTFWEDAVKTLCTTNASWGYTEKMCRNLCEQIGATAPSGLRTFPTPEQVIRYGERRLKEKVGMGYRSKSLMLLARKSASGAAPWLMDFALTPDATAAEKEIFSWHGFGTYATRHLLVLMGFHEYLPIDREVGNHLGIRRPGEKDSNLDSDHFEDWGKFRFTAYKLTRVAKRANWIGD